MGFVKDFQPCVRFFFGFLAPHQQVDCEHEFFTQFVDLLGYNVSASVRRVPRLRT